MTAVDAGMNGSKSTAGVEAMAAIPPAERMERNARLKRFLDSGDADGMTKNEIAEAVGISPGAVYSEFVKRRVPMTPGVPAKYVLPGTTGTRPGRRTGVPVARHGAAQEKIENYLRTGGEGNMSEIARATGVPRSTVGAVMARMGLSAPAPAAAPEPSRQEALAGVEAMVTAPAGSEPDGKLVYLHQISDGRHAFVDMLTGRLWVPDTFRPL